jgi:hypothetical protein
MGFRIMSALAGYAEAETKRIDQAREDALDLAKATLKYRTEVGMERRRDRMTRLRDLTNLGTDLMDNYGFTARQVGVLATQNKLEEVSDYYKKVSTDANFKGDIPDPSVVVPIFESKPLDVSYEDYMRSIVIGEVPSSPAAERDYSGMGMAERAAAKASDEYSKQFYGTLGVGEAELGAFASGSGFVTEREKGKVDLTSFRPGQKGARGDILFGKARNQIADTVASGLNLSSDFSPTGEFLGIKERGQRANQAAVIIDTAARRVEDLVEKNGQQYFGQAVLEVRRDLIDPRNLQKYYDEGMGGTSDIAIDIPGTATTQAAGVGGGGERTVAKPTTLFTPEQVTAIENAESVQDLRKIIVDLEGKPGMGDELRRIKGVMRDQNIPIDMKIGLILNRTSAKQPTLDQAETPQKPAAKSRGQMGRNRNKQQDTDGTFQPTEKPRGAKTRSQVQQQQQQKAAPDTATTPSQQEADKDLSDARSMLEAMGVNTNDVIAVRQVLKERSQGQLPIKVINEMARKITQDSMAGMV